MLLSIVIPIYKVEKYIRDTLNSIYNQNFDINNFEVICVNDGTPDNSMDIVLDFVNLYNNLYVINQDNQGLSCARNAGLKIAKGDFIWFIDSDDTISLDSLKVLKDIIKQNPSVDIYGFNMIRVQDDSKDEISENIILKTNHYNLYDKIVNKNQLIHKTHIAPVQRFVFNHTFLNKYSLKFYPNILHEDMEFMIKALLLADKIQLVNNSLYRYLVRTSGSIMSSIGIKSVHSKISIIRSLENFNHNSTHNWNDKAYLISYSFYMLENILKMKLDNSEYYEIVKNNLNRFRIIAFKSILANIYIGNIRKVLKSILCCINPLLLSKI